MIRENEFDRLEQFVKKLLASYDQLRNDNRRLREQLEEKNEELNTMRSQLDSVAAERGDISTRIKVLIDQIEEWQTVMGEQTSDFRTVDAEEPIGESQEEEGKEGGVQQNLFNVSPGTE